MKMIHQFLTPPKIGRRFKSNIKGESKTLIVIRVIRKMSNVGHRYEVEVELQ